ncbi:protein kinase-like protein [Aspergillus taichungensis]|uniref:Protein kinase-like protein n=1 Tax=Aspergillus taichungensis TaxID=482145 RepID=A0A2J5HUZ1_9EURO|nr:protein kinase-like protein [Aspergillus taichungensis]
MRKLRRPVALGVLLEGKTGLYTITKQLQECVWLAIAQNKETVVVKSTRHFCLQNEMDVLLRFQRRSPYFRTLLDEIEDPPGPPALILRHLEDNLLRASNSKRLSRLEVKYVARRVLEALALLHEDGFVHTVKSYARNGDPIGTPIFRSPEAQLQIRWGTETDIWSFDAMLISLMYGEGFHIFKPGVSADDDDYELQILMKHHRCFGPFPASYEEIADQDRIAALILTSAREIRQEDKEFVLKIMKLDPRDRPTARALLEDGWFCQP